MSSVQLVLWDLGGQEDLQCLWNKVNNCCAFLLGKAVFKCLCVHVAWYNALYLSSQLTHVTRTVLPHQTLVQVAYC